MKLCGYCSLQFRVFTRPLLNRNSQTHKYEPISEIPLRYLTQGNWLSWMIISDLRITVKWAGRSVQGKSPTGWLTPSQTFIAPQ